MRKFVAFLACLVVSLALTTLPAGPAQAATRAELKARAEGYLYTISVSTFITKRNYYLARERDGHPDPLEWGGDGCSAPSGVSLWWNGYFKNQCLRHDFGYRNMGNGYFASPSRAFDSTATSKSRLDRRFYDDMVRRCTSYPDPVACRHVAGLYYAGVTRTGQAQTAFYKGECPTGGLCLFDDTDYRDRRIRLTSSEDDMNDVSFGDKTSSVKNASSVAWIIFDDDGFDDRSYCIRPGRTVSSVGATWDFNDKTSSAKKLSTSTCP